MSRRRNEGAETFACLRDWTRGQAAAERLASQLLRIEGFKSIDPSHPLGGRDGIKDSICVRNGQIWIGAVYFPRGQQLISKITDKFKQDLTGVINNQVNGIAFVTNQELRLSERKKLKNMAGQTEVELLHLERVASILDSPQCYGIRLEFLDIEMTKEEQLAFIATRDIVIERLQTALDTIVVQLNNPELLKTLSSEQIQANIPLSEIREFKSILDSIAGFNPYVISAYPFGMGKAGHINDLHVPLAELREFADLLDRIAGNSDILTSPSVIFESRRSGHIRDLRVPLPQLQEYEATLDRVIQKLQEKKQLESS